MVQKINKLKKNKKSVGIQQQLINPYSPTQNDVSKRKSKTLVESA